MKCNRMAMQRYSNQSPKHWMSYFDFIDMSWKQIKYELRMGSEQEPIEVKMDRNCLQMYIMCDCGHFQMYSVQVSPQTRSMCVLCVHISIYTFPNDTPVYFIDRWLHIRCVYVSHVNKPEVHARDFLILHVQPYNSFSQALVNIVHSRNHLVQSSLSCT